MEWKERAQVLLAAALLAVLFSIADIGRIARNVLAADRILYFSAALLFTTTILAAALRWRKLSRAIGYQLSFRDSFKVIAISYGFNKIFPGNAGDLARSKIFERYRTVESHGNLIGIVALERYFSVLGLMSIVGLAGVFIEVNLVSGLETVLAVFGSLLVIFTLVLFLDKEPLEMLGSMAPGFAAGFLEDVLEGYRGCSRRQLFEVLGYSLYIRTAEAVVFYTLIVSVSAGIGFWEGALITSAMSLVSALPITPAGLGFVDAAGTGLLVAAGMGYSAALSLVILQRSLGVVLIAGIGAVVYAGDTYLEVLR